MIRWVTVWNLCLPDFFSGGVHFAALAKKACEDNRPIAGRWADDGKRSPDQEKFEYNPVNYKLKMKVKIKPVVPIFIIFNCLVSFFARSQFLVPRAGVSLATVSGNVNVFRADHEPEIQFTTGYYAGVGLLYPLEDTRVVLQTELLWINKGLESEVGPKEVFSELYQSNVDIYSFDRYKLNYLEMPLLFRVDFGKQDRPFFVLAGFSFSYVLTGKWHHFYSYQHPQESYTQTIDAKIVYKEPSRSGDDTQMTNRFDVGLQAGFGVVLYRGLTVEARYGHGLIGYSRKNQDTSAKNRVVQLGVALPFRLRKNS